MHIIFPTAPFDLWNRESPKGVKLYVQRVFITDQATQFLPLYLRFIRGVVDTSELALNVSRELLQQDEAIGAMRAALTRRVLDMLERLAEDADKYAKFWGEFGPLLKEGIVEDPANRERLAKLTRFSTTKTAGDEQTRSLAQYLADAKPEQLNDFDIVNMVYSMALAGHETTCNTIGNGMRALLGNREQWQRLIDEPSTIANAVEEILRYDGPVLNHRRLAKVDTEAAPALAAQYQIRSIPTLVLFKNGQEVARQAGAMGAADIARWVRAVP